MRHDFTNEKNRYEKAPLLAMSIDLAMKWIVTEFKKVSGKNLTAASVGNRENLREYVNKVRREDGTQTSKLDYPFLVYLIGDISLNTENGGLNKGDSRAEGFTLNKDVQSSRALHANLRPIKMGIGFNMNSDSLNDIIDFAHVLLMNAPKVVFQINLKDFQIAVSMNIEPSLQIPEANLESPGVAYPYQGLVTLDTYIGYQSEINLISNMVVKVQHSDKFPITDEVLHNGTIQSLIENKIDYTDYFNDDKNPYGDNNGNS